MSVLLVGELNPYGCLPEFALYHLPRHASGNRLRVILGLSDVDYEALPKVNLCYGVWSMKDARATVENLRATQWPKAVVMLGAKVKNAFGMKDLGFFEGVGCTPTLISLPHPSGLNRMWNEEGAVERAREVMRTFVPEIKWGSSTT